MRTKNTFSILFWLQTSRAINNEHRLSRQKIDRPLFRYRMLPRTGFFYCLGKDR